MRVRVVESGGFAGLRKERVLEASDLAPGDRGRFEALVQRAAFFELPERMIGGLPDMIQYRIRVDAAARTHEVVFDDGTASEVLLTIVAEVFRLTEPPR